MSNFVPPEQRPPRLRDDEPIAILVALLAFGAIFTWAISQGKDGLNVFSWLNGAISSQTNANSLIVQSPSPLESPLSNPLLKQPQKGNADKGTTDTGKKGSPSEAEEPETALPIPSVAPTASATPPIAPDGGSPAPGSAANPTAPNATVSPSPSPTGTTPGSGSPGAGLSGGLQGGQVPIVPPAASVPAIDFPDVPPSYWAYPFIRDLSTRGVIGGFPDGSFQPDQPVTRGQFAIQLQKAFTKADRLPPKSFADVPKNYAIAVDKAVKSNFMSGYPDGNFRPDQNVSRTEAVISLIRGLGLPEPADPEAILQAYQDQAQVPSWARAKIAAAIQAKVFSGDPDTMLLNPNQPATRADIAAFVYKSLGLPDPTQ